MTTSDDAKAETFDDDDSAVILAAVDTSPLTTRVLEAATRMARRTWGRATLHVMHVFESSRVDRLGSAGVKADDLRAEAERHLAHQVRMAARQFPGTVTGHLGEGDPVDLILHQARAVSADLLVVGTHDLVGLERMLMGSIADKLTKRAPCSVYVVRPKQRPYVAAST